MGVVLIRSHATSMGDCRWLLLLLLLVTAVDAAVAGAVAGMLELVVVVGTGMVVEEEEAATACAICSYLAMACFHFWGVGGGDYICIHWRGVAPC